MAGDRGLLRGDSRKEEVEIKVDGATTVEEEKRADSIRGRSEIKDRINTGGTLEGEEQAISRGTEEGEERSREGDTT